MHKVCILKSGEKMENWNEIVKSVHVSHAGSCVHLPTSLAADLKIETWRHLATDLN